MTYTQTEKRVAVSMCECTGVHPYEKITAVYEGKFQQVERWELNITLAKKVIAAHIALTANV